MVEADIDGRALSTMSKDELRSLARQASPALHSASRKNLYAAVASLKEGDAGGEWVALHGSECFGGRGRSCWRFFWGALLVCPLPVLGSRLVACVEVGTPSLGCLC